MADVFFSYSSKDRDRVRPAQEALSGLGYDVFWDQEVPPGQDWDTWIRGHLEKASCVAVFWSANSVASANVRHEATRAAEQGKLIPLLLDPLKAEQFPMGHYTIQAADLTGWRGDVRAPSWQRALAAIETKVPQPDALRLRNLLRENQAALRQLQQRRGGGWLRFGMGLVACGLASVGGFQLGRQYPASSAKDSQAGLSRETTLPSVSSPAEVNLSARELSEKADDYYVGRNGVAKDPTKAFELFLKAASLGNAYSANSAAYQLSRGEGVSRNDVEAARLFSKAADGANAEAMAWLGIFHTDGRGGLPINLTRANEFFHRAYEAGSETASYWLAFHYDQGKGLKVDRSKAALLMIESIMNGQPKARESAQTRFKGFSLEFRTAIEILLRDRFQFKGMVDGQIEDDTVLALVSLFNQNKK